MNQQRSRIVCVGEAMIELARGSDGRFGIGCGGDTFNAAIYLARAGMDVAFATALGNDPYSDGVLALAATENVASDLVLRVPGRLPGLYLIDRDGAGERRLYHWADAAPVRDLFELDHWDRIAEGLLAARMVYFSGITLSLFSNVGIGRFLAVLELARKAGVKIAFDCNFRPHGWKGDLGRARTVFIETLKRVDLALPAFDDEAVLWGDPSPESTVERMQAFGIRRGDREERPEQRAGGRRRRARARSGSRSDRADRHAGGRRRLQCRLSRRPAQGRGGDRGGAGRPSPGRRR